MTDSYTRTGLFTGSYLTGPIPTEAPRFVGQIYIVTEGKHYDDEDNGFKPEIARIYVAKGTSSYKDWVQDHLFSTTEEVDLENLKAGEAIAFDVTTGRWKNEGGHM